MSRLNQFVRSARCLSLLAGLAAPTLVSAGDARPSPTRPSADAGQPYSPGEREDRDRGRGMTANDFPGLEARDWVNAVALSTQARTVFRHAEADLVAGIGNAKAKFEHSRDFRDAQSAQQQAYADYAAARDKAIANLANNSRYHEIVKLRDEMDSKLEARKHDKTAPKDDLMAMASLKMGYATDARQIEAQALASSPDLKAARDKMVAASAKVSEMRQSFDDNLRDAPEIAQLRKNNNEARIQMITSDQYAWAAATSLEAAYCYGIRLHGLDQGHYDPYYNPGALAYGGYGNGAYYSPFWGR